jgi:hypothetical protein
VISLRSADSFFAGRKSEIAATLLLAALTVLMFVVFFALPADDAYIVARYVRQLYYGHGLVFNPGERINAITSPLLTFVIAAIHPLSREPVDIYRVAAALLTAWTLVTIARRAYPTRVAAPSALHSSPFGQHRIRESKPDRLLNRPQSARPPSGAPSASGDARCSVDRGLRSAKRG